MNSRLEILHLITELNQGGAEQLLVGTMQQVEQGRPFYHRVVSLYDGNTPLAEAIRKAGVPVHDLKMKGSGRVRGLWHLRQRLRQHRPVIIHNWLYHAAILGRLVGRLHRVPIIVTSRHSVNLGSRLRTRINRWTGRLDDRTIVICDYMREVELAHRPGNAGRIVTIFNGIPVLELPKRENVRPRLLQELEMEPETIIIGTVGRLHRAKGHADLLHAVADLAGRRPDLHFVWIGDGPERSNLEKLTRSMGVADRVHLLGDRHDVARWLAAMDVFALPSRWEGISLALLEAMSAGLPVVATAVGGTPEVIVDGETGLLVPSSDPEAMAEAIMELIEDSARAAAFGRAARCRVQERFSMGRMWDQLGELYLTLVEEKLRLQFVERPTPGWVPRE